MAGEPGRRPRGHRFIPGGHHVALGLQASDRTTDGSLRVPGDGQETSMGSRCTGRTDALLAGVDTHRPTRGTGRPTDADRRAHQQLCGDAGRRCRRHGDRSHTGAGARQAECLHEFRQDDRLGRDRGSNGCAAHDCRARDDGDHGLDRRGSRPARHDRHYRARR